MTELEYCMKKMYNQDYQCDPKQPSNIISPNIEVDYDDSTHTYRLKNKIYRSATTIVSQFYVEFDTKERSQYMADRYGKDSEYWKQEWKRVNNISLDRGNGIHNEQEDFLYNRGFTSVTGPRIYRVYNLKEETGRDSNRGINVSSLADGCYPELKLWRHDWCIAGRADKPTIETIGKIRYAHIEDYKTNKILHTQGYWDARHPEPRKMLAPIDHLDDCEMTHYTLQLSIYQYMLEYFGFKPGIRRIIHFLHPIEGLGTPKPVIHELPYLRKEVEAMLYHLMGSKWLNI